jgi:RNA polymerase sigma factor (sigma-70 family)
MTNRPTSALLHYIRQIAPPSQTAGQTDGQLLERFLADRDEAAFAALLQRHGPLVLAVCRRILSHRQDSEDAFQATFLVLVRKARSIAKRGSLGCWLYGVARRIAVRARTASARRNARERCALPRTERDPLHEVVWRDLRLMLDEEVERLPWVYREPFLLCYMEGKTNEEAARLLGCPKGTVLSRLSRARERLRVRLARRGLGLSAGLVATLMARGAADAAVPVELAESTLRAAMWVAAESTATLAAASAPVLSLTEGVLRAMFLTKVKIATAVLLGVGVLGAGTGVSAYRTQTGDAAGTKQGRPTRPAADDSRVAAGESQDRSDEATRKEQEALERARRQADEALKRAQEAEERLRRREVEARRKAQEAEESARREDVEAQRRLDEERRRLEANLKAIEQDRRREDELKLKELKDLAETFRGEVDLYLSPARLEVQQPSLSGVRIDGIRVVAGKKFLRFRKDKEVWLIDPERIVAAQTK